MYYGWNRECIICKREFQHRRSDHIYCCGACKQVAYRRRGGAASKGVTVPAIEKTVTQNKPFMERRK